MVERADFGIPVSRCYSCSARDSYFHQFIITLRKSQTVVCAAKYLAFSQNQITMFQRYLTLILAVLPFCSSAQIVQWATCADPASSLTEKNICSDQFGNSYLTGSYEQDFIFGSQTVIHTDDWDVYIAKLDPSGAPLWVKSLGSTGRDIANGITVDLAGNVYVTGSFQSSFTVDTIFTAASSANYDVFLIKLDTDGNAQWVKTSQGVEDSFSEGYDVDYGGGYIYVAGVFQRETWFDTDTVNVNSVNSSSFVGKFTLDGELEWTFTCEEGSESNRAQYVHAQGNQVIVSGSLNSHTQFDTVPIGDTVSIDADSYILKLTDLGQFKWVKYVNGGTIQRTTIVGIESDWMGNVYFAGSLADYCDIDGVVLTGSGSDTKMIGKLDSDGNVVWFKTIGTGSDNRSYSLALTQQGTPFICGTYFGSTSLDNFQLIAAGVSECFLAKLNADGEVQWVETFGGTTSASGYDAAISMDVNQNNQVFVLSMVSESDVQVGPYTLTCAPTEGIMIAKFDGTVTGIDQTYQPEKELLVYPNPANDRITVKLPWEGECTINIFNAQGQLVLTRVSSQQTVELALPRFDAGLYFVSVTCEKRGRLATTLVIVD
jgi:hypothetical protein